jgi:argininosuccinate lyase
LPSGYHRDLQLLKKDYFQPFKTWKPAWYCNFLHKDIKVKTIFLPIQNTIICLQLTP